MFLRLPETLVENLAENLVTTKNGVSQPCSPSSIDWVQPSVKNLRASSRGRGTPRTAPYPSPGTQQKQTAHNPLKQNWCLPKTKKEAQARTWKTNRWLRPIHCPIHPKTPPTASLVDCPLCASPAVWPRRVARNVNNLVMNYNISICLFWYRETFPWYNENMLKTYIKSRKP